MWLNRHWIECLTTDQEAAGSSPAMVVIFVDFFCSARALANAATRASTSFSSAGHVRTAKMPVSSMLLRNWVL